MKQVTQTLKTGVVEVRDVPVPSLSDSFVLVSNSASVISAGTEKTKIDMGKKNLLQKAKARPDLVKQVIKKVKTEGLGKTLQTVSSRLNSPSPLGYSCAGIVVASGGLVEGIKPGDRVACGGADYANHAEFVAVPKNLVVKIPEGVSDEEAAFTTVGSIALQGIRLAEPKLGETFLVLGLGLLGQIAVQLLRANGCTVLATDLDPALVERAQEYGARGLMPGTDLVSACHELTSGYGVDGVLVCAGTSSNQPIELCGAVTRSKGRVIVVGAVRMDIPREDYFKKEISVVISRSYGPGRYDPFYEESGNDYPLAYVRFTEQRNMQTFLELIAQKKVDVKGLITHRFDIDDAAEAYQLIEGEKREPYLGIVMNYAASETGSTISRISTSTSAIDKEMLGVSFVGAGNYATASLIPPMMNSGQVEFRGLITASGRSAQGVANQFGFKFCASEFAELTADDTDVVVITSRHDSHATMVTAALRSHKHVYVEKPLALNVEELQAVHEAYKGHSGCQLMVGFNRRFAPLTLAMIAHFKTVQSPLVINVRVNSGSIPTDHWIQDPKVGGGRVIGEGCHFVDLASALAQSNPVSVSAIGTSKSNKSALLNDNVIITLNFANGSIATIAYVADGSKAMQKEYVEVFGGGRSGEIRDFKEASFYEGDSKVSHKKLSAQDKGQRAMLSAWLEGVRSGEPCISYECLQANSLATIMAVESLTIGAPINVDLAVLDVQGEQE